MTTGGNLDLNQDERVELRKAYQLLRDILRILTNPNEMLNRSIKELERSSIQLRGIPTTSRRAGLLNRISDMVLELIDRHSKDSKIDSTTENMTEQILKLVRKGIRSVDNRLTELRKSLVGRESPFIDERMGNYRFSIFSVGFMVYLGGIVIVTVILDLSIVLPFLLFSFIIVALLTTIDLFMVVYTKPFWLYLPSENAILSRIFNWEHLWTILIPLSGIILFSIISLVIGILFLLDTTLGVVLSGTSLVLTYPVYRFSQWRKREYLCCPNKKCTHLDFRNSSSLVVHYEEVHGVDIKSAVDELRTRLSKKKKDHKERRFRELLGYLLVIVSWFFCFETLIFLKVGDLIRFLILLIADIVLFWWAFYELHILLEPSPKNIPEKKKSDAEKQASRAALEFIMFPQFIKIFLVNLFVLLFANLLDLNIAFLIAVFTLNNSGFTLGIVIPYFRNRYHKIILKKSRWEEVFSKKRCTLWILVTYIIYLVVGLLSFIGGFEFIEVFRFSYMTSDLFIFAWSADLFSAVKTELIEK